MQDECIFTDNLNGITPGITLASHQLQPMVNAELLYKIRHLSHESGLCVGVVL